MENLGYSNSMFEILDWPFSDNLSVDICPFRGYACFNI